MHVGLDLPLARELARPAIDHSLRVVDPLHLEEVQLGVVRMQAVAFGPDVHFEESLAVLLVAEHVTRRVDVSGQPVVPEEALALEDREHRAGIPFVTGHLRQLLDVGTQVEVQLLHPRFDEPVDKPRHLESRRHIVAAKRVPHDNRPVGRLVVEVDEQLVRRLVVGSLPSLQREDGGHLSRVFALEDLVEPVHHLRLALHEDVAIGHALIEFGILPKRIDDLLGIVVREYEDRRVPALPQSLQEGDVPGDHVLHHFGRHLHFGLVEHVPVHDKECDPGEMLQVAVFRRKLLHRDVVAPARGDVLEDPADLFLGVDAVVDDERDALEQVRPSSGHSSPFTSETTRFAPFRMR